MGAVRQPFQGASSDATDMTHPLITIGITAFNAEDSIETALDSALSQTWENVEVVVVDDVSSDRTMDLLEARAEKDERIRVLRQNANGGVAATRNRIIAEARGAFIAFFDDDDISDPTRLARQYESLVRYEAAHAGGALVISHTARRQVLPDGGERYAAAMGGACEHEAPSGPAVASHILTGKPLRCGPGGTATCSQMARTRTYRDLGGFDPAFRRSEDMEFSVRAARAGAHFVGLAAPLVTQNWTKTPEKSLQIELRYKLALIEKHRDVFSNAREYRFACDWMKTKYDGLAYKPVRFVAGLARLALTEPVLTFRRIGNSLPNLAGNRAFAQFHKRGFPQ